MENTSPELLVPGQLPIHPDLDFIKDLLFLGGYWSIIEVDVGVFCLCMPALRTFLGHLYPTVFGSTRGDASTTDHPISHNKARAPENSSNTSFVPLVDVDHTPLKSHQDSY